MYHVFAGPSFLRLAAQDSAVEQLNQYLHLDEDFQNSGSNSEQSNDNSSSSFSSLVKYSVEGSSNSSDSTEERVEGEEFDTPDIRQFRNKKSILSSTHQSNSQSSNSQKQCLSQWNESELLATQKTPYVDKHRALEIARNQAKTDMKVEIEGVLASERIL